MDDLRRATTFWDGEHQEPRAHTWMEHPLVREAINRRIGGERPQWPMDWFGEWTRGKTFRRGLSIGCGTGALERDLIRRRICGSIDAIDISLSAVVAARAAADDAGMGDVIRYFVADFNRLRLPRNAWDLILFHQSLHHVDRLERLMSEILPALEPEGLLFLDEYVGPSRTWWTPGRFRDVRSVYDRLPARHRLQPKLLLPIHGEDPSEGVRSGEILPVIGNGFDVVARRPYGGNLLAPIFSALDPQTPDDVIRSLIEEEDALLRGNVTSNYQIIVARPRTGHPGRAALRRYAAGALAHAVFPQRLLLYLRRFARRVYVAVDRRLRGKPIDHYV
jgi:SAM-dependent methyltransferase